ncbi:insulinase family protein, partial [bacterium]|nr:insulinase family protein [bacterium]
MKHFTIFIILLTICLGTFQSTIAAPQLRWYMQLDNGMDIIIIEDHSSPLAASIINIRAGSHTETLEMNGISHLLEHLLFDGTDIRSAAQLKEEVEAQGGYNNAFTRKDFVSFEIVMPTDNFLNGLEIQFDQLLQSNFPETEFIREKSVVCEEIATNIRSSSSAADDAMWEALFGSSGYGLPVIGNYQTVTDVLLEQVVNFYKSRYVPNRMTAVVIGDVDPHLVLEKFRELYGNIKRGLENPGPGALPEFPVDGKRVIVQRPVGNRAVMMALPAPAPDDPAFRPFQIAVSLWADSPDSLFQKALEPFATRVGAYISKHKGFSLLQIVATPVELTEPGQQDESDVLLKKMESAVMISIQTFLEQLVTQADVMRQVQSSRVDHEFAREKFHHLAREIGEYAALDSLGHYWNFDREIAEIIPDSVTAAFSMWVRDVMPVSVLVEPVEAKSDTAIDLNHPQMKILSNGLTVIAHFDPYADMTAIHLLTPNPGSSIAGVPRIVAEMLDDGTTKMTAAEIETSLQNRGIRTKLADWTWLPFDDYYDSIEYNYFRMESLSGDLDVALDLMAQMVFQSTLPDKAWNKLSRTMAIVASRSAGSSSSVSKTALRNIMFLDGYHKQTRLPGTDDLQAISSEMLREYYSRAYNPATCILSVVGNVQPDELFELAEQYFGVLPVTTVLESPVPEFNSPQRVFTAVDDGMAYIRAAIRVDASPDTIPTWSLTADVLSELLQEEIRATRGKSYRLGAWLNEQKGGTFLEIGIGTRAENLVEIEMVAREIV